MRTSAADSPVGRISDQRKQKVHAFGAENCQCFFRDFEVIAPAKNHSASGDWIFCEEGGVSNQALYGTKEKQERNKI